MFSTIGSRKQWWGKEPKKNYDLEVKKWRVQDKLDRMMYRVEGPAFDVSRRYMNIIEVGVEACKRMTVRSGRMEQN